MEITYFGLNAVRLRGREATVMIDPYEPKLGLSPVRLNVQIVVLTHEDPTHFSLQGLAGDPHVVPAPAGSRTKAAGRTERRPPKEAKRRPDDGINSAYPGETTV